MVEPVSVLFLQTRTYISFLKQEQREFTFGVAAPQIPPTSSTWRNVQKNLRFHQIYFAYLSETIQLHKHLMAKKLQSQKRKIENT